MKNIILILGIVWFGSSEAALQTKQIRSNFLVSAGAQHTCAIDDSGVKCWGDNRHGQTDVPELKNSEQVSSRDDTTCAIDDGGVKCWGWLYDGQADVPQLQNPVQVSAAFGETCAIDDSGVKCWGRSDLGRTPIPQLKNPVQVSTGGYHACAIDDDGVKCWGSNDHGQTDVPQLKNPIQISAGDLHTCAIDDSGVKCWGWNGYGQNHVPELKNPVQVSAGVIHTCAIDDSGVKCWGDNKHGQTDVPQLKNPAQVTVGFLHTCAIDKSGVKCWGGNYDGQTDVPQLKYFLISSATAYLTLSKSTFLRQLEKFQKIASVTALEVKEQLLIGSIISPVILGTDSDYFNSSVIPIFNGRMRRLHQQIALPLEQNPLPEIEATLESRKIALTAIQSSLDVSLSFLSGQQIDRTQDALRKVGQAMIDPMNDKNIFEALKSVESLKEERAVLLSSEKSKFLIECQQVALDWLKLKVK